MMTYVCASVREWDNSFLLNHIIQKSDGLINEMAHVWETD